MSYETKRIQNVCYLLRKQHIDKALIGDLINIAYLTGIHVTTYERFYGII